MSKLTGAEIAGVDAETVARMSRAEIESFALQAAGMVLHLANQAAAASSNSSRPLSSDPPWRRDRAGKPAAASAAAKPEAAAANADKKPEKPSGKRPGMPGFCRRQPLVVHENVPHRPHRMWVMVTATAVTFRIGSRAKQTLVELVSEAFLGWLVTDGYVAYRDRERRQRCLAHLIRQAIALSEGYDCNGSGFGRDLRRDLRSLTEKVADEKPAERDAKAERAIKRLLGRIKWNCQCHQHDFAEKVRALAGEILRDWDAVIAFVTNPLLPATNTVVETCRKRKADPWAYVRDLIAAARTGALPPKLPAPAAA